MSLLLAVAIGFLLGLRHALDADHVVAVTTIVTRERSFRGAALTGAWWGVGHSIALLVVGGGLVLFRMALPPRVALVLELGVAAMLIGLGFRNLASGPGAPEPVASGTVLRRPLLIGVMHGLAGSAAVALLVLATIPTVLGGLAYLGLFGLGTIAGMTVVTALLAAPAVLGTRTARLERGVRFAAGVLSIALGVFLAYQIVVGGGLFSTAPVWTAR